MSDALNFDTSKVQITITPSQNRISMKRYKADPRNPRQSIPGTGLSITRGEFAWHPATLDALIEELERWRTDLKTGRK